MVDVDDQVLCREYKVFQVGGAISGRGSLGLLLVRVLGLPSASLCLGLSHYDSLNLVSI
jgi:hypothetical protein